MPLDAYSGSIDWNRIYRSFHAPCEVAMHVQRHFPNMQLKVLFAGFPETAARLCQLGYTVRLIEYSPAIAQMARETFPELQELHVGDVLDVLAEDSSPYVAIICRISAYWHNPESFSRLIYSLKRFPRRRVLIDFYDREAVGLGSRVEFLSQADYGAWDFLGFEEVASPDLSIAISTMTVEYSLDDKEVRYTDKRAFFRRADILSYLQRELPQAVVTAERTLIVDDPSFLVNIEFS